MTLTDLQILTLATFAILCFAIDLFAYYKSRPVDAIPDSMKEEG
ncbi:hypothetical protein [Tumebacillus flagellatus]|nr:hypothetical protein [Tumebacillus flagellatus]